MIKPTEANSTPTILFESEEDDCYWTLVMSNPDGHFTEDNCEYLHWMVGNIPSKSANLFDNQDGTKNSDVNLASFGEDICPYLQPFPPYGTGFHRFVFVLYKHVSTNYSHIIFEANF